MVTDTSHVALQQSKKPHVEAGNPFESWGIADIDIFNYFEAWWLASAAPEETSGWMGECRAHQTKPGPLRPRSRAETLYCK